MAPPPYNVAVIGYGKKTRYQKPTSTILTTPPGMSAKVFHIPLVEALPESFTLYGIVQRTPKPNDDASKDHTEIKLWNSSDAMLQDPAVDIVVISSIPSAHFSQAKAALEAGKHVIVEKPFCPTSSEASELVQIATASKKLLTVYQNRRWDLDFLTLKQVLAEGHLGEIAEFETHYDRYRPQLPVASERTWKNRDLPAGGSLFDLGSHLLDQVYHLFGAPQSVTGFVGVQKRGLTDCAPDFCTVLLEYAEEKGKPSFVTVKSSSLSTEEEQLRFWVRGSKGSFKKVTSHLECKRTSHVIADVS